MAHDTSTTAVLDSTVDDVVRTQTRLEGPPPFCPKPPQGYGDGDRHGDDEPSTASSLQNACLGRRIFLGAETMFFAGLIGAFLAFRLAIAPWLPQRQTQRAAEFGQIATEVHS